MLVSSHSDIINVKLLGRRIRKKIHKKLMRLKNIVIFNAHRELIFQDLVNNEANTSAGHELARLMDRKRRTSTIITVLDKCFVF